MFHLTIKNLWAHKLRLSLTGIAVVLGVSFMAGTMVLTETMGATFDDMFETANSGVDIIIQQPDAVSDGNVESRARLPESVVARVESVSGVAVAAGSIFGFAQLVLDDGTTTALGGLGQCIGINWIDDDSLNPFVIASGRAPVEDDEVVLDQTTVDSEGWDLGRQVTVVAGGEPVRFELVGIATFGDLPGVPGSPLVALNDHSAQRHFAQPGYFDSVRVSAEAGVENSRLIADIDGALGAAKFEVMSGDEDTSRKQSDLKEDLAFFNQFLMTFAFVSLFVGTFIIYNTFSILVAQRTRENAMLRAIGAGRAQLLRSTVLESLVIGVVAGAVGLVTGIGMSFGLKSLIGAAGLEVPDGATVVSVRTVVSAFVVGVIVTVVSASGPALRSSRVRPMAALRDVAAEKTSASRARSAIGLAMTFGGALAFALGTTGGDGGPSLLGLGSVTTILGMFVLGPVVARPVIRVLGAPIARWRGATGRLARENAARSPKRSSATASALMVGVALVGFITILATSTKLSINDAIDKAMRADFMIESGSAMQGGFETDLARRLSGLPEVAALSAYRSAPGEVDGTPASIDSVDTATLEDLYDLNVTSGSIGEVVTGTIALSEDRASQHGVGIGDTIRVRFASSEAELQIVALYDSMFPEGGYLVDNSTIEQHVADQFDKKIFVSIRDEVDLEDARRALEEELASQPTAELQDQATFKKAITAGVDSLLTLVYGLLALAVIIALIGIANTLALSVHERRREIGLLRALGMTRTQVRGAIRWEAVLIALLGTSLGMVLAVASAWGIAKALEPNVSRFAVPFGQLAVIALMAASAGILAALGPARRAARLNVLDAIESE